MNEETFPGPIQIPVETANEWEKDTTMITLSKTLRKK